MMWFSQLFNNKEEDKAAEPVDTESRLGRLEMSASELVMVIGPKDDNCVCGDWVGAVLSVNGNHKEYPSMPDAVDDGLLHPQCRHNLATYDPQKASPEKAKKAQDCTRHAIAAMKSRGENIKLTINPMQADKQTRDDTTIYSKTLSPTVKFERVYKAARDADVKGDYNLALEKCKAALDILNEEDIFGEAQGRILLILQARLNKLHKQT